MAKAEKIKPQTYPPLNMVEEMFMELVKANSDIGYGRMMQMISGLWRDEHGDAAAIASDTFAGRADKLKRCKREGHDWGPSGTAFAWCDRCGASRPKKK